MENRKPQRTLQESPDSTGLNRKKFSDGQKEECMILLESADLIASYLITKFLPFPVKIIDYQINIITCSERPHINIFPE